MFVNIQKIKLRSDIILLFHVDPPIDNNNALRVINRQSRSLFSAMVFCDISITLALWPALLLKGFAGPKALVY